MQASQTPTLVPLAFAASGTKNVIPENSQIGITPGAASLQDGFPPLTFTPIAAGGVPPAGADFNGVLNLITQTIRWKHAGGQFGYSSTFANDANVSGYPRGALLLRSDQSGMWLNQTDSNTTNPDTGGAGWSAAFVSGTVGQSRNLSMNVATAAATATLTADEIVVGTSLGGHKYVLGSFSKTINLATTGAGGMDTGTAPVSGYVALYAIYNPTTQISALLATNATSVVAPNVYGGANMPSGYTASALVSVVRTNSSGQFVPFCQNDRLVSVAVLNILNSTASQPGYTALSIAAAVPKNAKTWSGTGSANCNANGSTINSLNLSADLTNEIGNMVISNSAAVLNQGNFAPISNFPIMTPQTVCYKNLSSTGTPISILSVSGYTF
jgi:hypothetical protein